MHSGRTRIPSSLASPDDVGLRAAIRTDDKNLRLMYAALSGEEGHRPDRPSILVRVRHALFSGPSKSAGQASVDPFGYFCFGGGIGLGAGLGGIFDGGVPLPCCQPLGYE